MWTLDSYSIWYDKEPIETKQDIAAYRRYEIGSEHIKGVGIGIIVDAATAFFSVKGLDYFFEEDLPEKEQKRRLAKFNRLTDRDARDQQGTLLYSVGGKKP